MSNYKTNAIQDAKKIAQDFKDEILESFIDAAGQASDDLLNDYNNGNAYHHKNHEDKYYNLSDADDLLNELGDYLEDDDGLWQGLQPREAVSVQAAYTYANAVIQMFKKLIREINRDGQLEEFMQEYDDVPENIQTELDEAKADGKDSPFPNADKEEEKRQNIIQNKIQARINDLIDSFCD